jgi:AcrR family transcriptional regulator
LARTSPGRKPREKSIVAADTAKAAPTPRVRRRRSPELAELEILDAAEKLLRRRSFHELTVAEVMAGTGLARPSFYQYFADLHQLLAKLTERYIAEVISIAETSIDMATDPAEPNARERLLLAYEHGCRLIRKRRHLHRALVDAAPGDPSVERIHRRYMNTMAGFLEKQLRAAQELGHSRKLEPKETARALQLMGEHYIIEKLVKRSGADVAEVAGTLVAIMETVLFGP